MGKIHRAEDFCFAARIEAIAVFTNITIIESEYMKIHIFELLEETMNK